MSLLSWCQLLLTCPMHRQASQALPDQRRSPQQCVQAISFGAPFLDKGREFQGSRH